MSSVFEGVPQDPGVFSAFAAPRRSWPKIVAAFAAGAACTVLVITLVPIARNAPQPPPARILQRTSADVAAAPSLSATRGQQPADMPAPAQAPKNTHAPAPPEGAVAEAPVVNSAPAAADTNDVGSKQSADLNCERQTWPYVDHSCAGPDTNAQARRSVRVIATDRSAPATVMTAPARVPRTTDGMAPPPASTTDRTTDGSAGNTGVASPREQAPADQPQQLDGDIAAAQIDVPLPRPKPDELARTGALPAKGSEEVRQAATTAVESAGESRSTSKSRADRSNARQSAARRDTATTNAGGAASRAKEGVRETPEEDRAVRTRTVEEPARVVRPRAASAEDDDGYTLVRSSRSRDGRRVSVQQKPVEEDGGVAVREERPRSFFPFFFNPAAVGD
jgi:hypothetical protein